MKTLSTSPKFCPHQQVHFLGGNGTIRFFHPDGNNWLYGVEMPLGTEPDLGRIGHETVVLIPETELYVLQATEKK